MMVRWIDSVEELDWMVCRALILFGRICRRIDDIVVWMMVDGFKESHMPKGNVSPKVTKSPNR